MDDFQIPKGATAVAPAPLTAKSDSDFQLPKGAVPVGSVQKAAATPPTAKSDSDFQLPKGAVPVGSAQKTVATPNFGVQPQPKPQAAVVNGKPVNVPSGLTIDSPHTDKLMDYLREPARLRQQVYDSTIKEGYTPEQAQKRLHEYDYAISQGMAPDNAWELAQGIAFDSGQKYQMSEQEKAAMREEVKQKSIAEQKQKAMGGQGVQNAVQRGLFGTQEQYADKYAKHYVERYAWARSQGKPVAESREFADGVLPEWVDRALASTGLGSEHSWILSDKGERNTRFAVAKWADSFEKEHPKIGPYIGETGKGLTDLGVGLTSPQMVAIAVASAVTDGLAEVAPFARGAEEAEEVTEAEKATSLAGRWRRAVSKAKKAAGDAAAKVPRAVGSAAGRAFGELAPEEAAEASKVAGTAAESVEKATQAIQDAKLPVSAVRVARTMRDATHMYFSYTMTAGVTEGVEKSAELIGKKDYPHAVAAFIVDTLVGGWMAYGGAKGVFEREQFTAKADAMTERLYGTPADVEGEGPQQRAATKFGELNDYQQAVVLSKLIEEDPTYNHRWVESKKEHDRRVNQLAYRYNFGLQQAWNPDAVKRAVRLIDTHHAANEFYDAKQKVEDAARDHYLKQITARLKAAVEAKEQEQEQREAYEAEQQERRAAAREGRTPKKSEAAQKREDQRKVTLASAAQVAEARQGVGAAREEAERESAEQERQAAEKPAEPQGVVRHPDEVTDDEGYISYRGRVFGGEEHHFGVAQNDKTGQWGVYRRTPDGIEYLSAGGIFEPKPEQPFIAADEAAARTLAQITSLRVNAAYAREQHGSTPERDAERKFLGDLEHQLVDGTLTADQVRKTAGLPEEAVEEQAKEKKTNHEIEAARVGALNGPLHGRTRAQFEDEFLAGLEEAGWQPERIEVAIDTIGPTLRMEAENNLHYVGQSGDWIASKKGVTWVLDSKGMLQPDDGLSAPIPLMKNGRYTAQAIDLSMSGRVGFGQRSWEDAKVDEQKEREANQQLDNLAQNVADELENAIKLSKQNAGLKLEAGELPVERPAPKPKSKFAPPVEGQMAESPERETDRAVEEGYAASQAEKSALNDLFINAIGDWLGENHETPWGILQRIGRNSGLSGQRVLELYMERTAPKTLDEKIERLKAGDIISDKIGLPWIVEADNNGTLYLRKGQGARIHINKFKPSDDVRRIVGTGEIQSAPGPRYTPEDVRKAAFEAHYIAAQNKAVDEVKERVENPPPAPKTPEQAQAEVVNAKVREAHVVDAATQAATEATNPAPTATDAEIDEAVKKAAELAKTAKAAGAQTAKAKGYAAGPGKYPRKASISSKNIPSRAWAVGELSYVDTDEGRIPVHLELVKPEALSASFVWNGNQIERNPEFPEAMQDVPPDEKTREEILIDAQPGRYDVDKYLDPGFGYSLGPAIVEEGGDIAGGNRRFLRMMKYLEHIRSDEIALALFKDKMKNYARKNGMVYPEGDDIYIPVRMLEDRIETIERATQLGSLLNKPVSSGIDEDNKAITYGRLLVEAQEFEAIATPGQPGIIDRIGNEFNAADTPRQAMANNPDFFVDVVKKYFRIGSTEGADWFRTDANGKQELSVRGKERFEKALLATIIDTPSALESIRENAPNAHEALLKAIGPMGRLPAIPDKDIIGIIKNAVSAAAQTGRKRVEGDSPRIRWNKTYSEMDMYSTEPPPQEPGTIVEALWRALHDRKTTRFKNALNDYLVGEGQQASFFEAETKLKKPSELFNAAFEPELKEVRDARGLNTPGATSGKFKNENASGMRVYLDTLPWEVTDAEFNAAMQNREMSDEAVADAKRSEEGKPPVEEPKPEPSKKITPPPAETPKPEAEIAAAKAEKGYVTPDELEKFLAAQAPTADHTPEIMRTARMMAEYVFDADPPEGVDRKDALAWVLKERVAKLEYKEKGKGRGSYSDPNVEKGIGTRILALTKAADETTFIHEFAHIIFPMLSEEDMRAIDTITGEAGEHWKHGEPLRGEAYKTVSEKFAHGLEKFLRDENPTGFSAEVKKVLAKVKEMFQAAYMRFRNDPLSTFNLSEDAKEVFAKMFHIEDLDPADDWRKQREAARKEDAKQKKGMVKPEAALHPVQQLAKDLGPKPLQILESVEGAVEDSSGERVDPSKPTASFVYPDIDNAGMAFVKAVREGSGIAGVELVTTKDGKYALRFNVKDKVPKDVLYQPLPEKNAGLRLEELESLLKTTTSPMLKKFLETQIAVLKAEIRNEPKPESRPELAKQAIAEVKNGREGRKTGPGGTGVSDLRGVPDGTPRHGQSGTGRISRPPVMGMPGHAGATDAGSRGRPGGGSPQPTNLAAVKPVDLVPLPERGAPVGILAGDAFDEKAWRDGLKRSGLPENSPAPTETISKKTADVAKFAGQKQSVQIIRSALKQGDGAVLASATGTGKTYVLSGVAYETLLENPNAKILYITKNRGLLKDASGVAKDFYGLELETDQLTTKFDKNFYGATYSRLRNNELYKKMQWDLVLADESGEARNWYLPQEEPKPGKKPKVHQGMLLKKVMDNAKKGVYVSATPFHSPMEYGYLDKLNLWPKGQFEQWIRQNFKHETIGNKTVAQLDPAKQAKLREQMIERGQFVSQEISYDGYSIHFGLVPVTDVIEDKLDRIHQGIAVMRRELLKQGKAGLAERIGTFEATYTKQFMERSRIAETIQLANRGRAMGWQVGIFSENTSEDLFRRPLIDSDGNVLEEAGTYRLLDEETGGQISRIMPEFPNMFTELQAEFGSDIGDFSGRGNTDAQRRAAKEAFMKGEKPILYTTYAAGGVGVSLHDTDGDKPRLAIFTGPPYSGVLLEQALGRFWRFGTKSNVYAVFLASDAEPDIRLMATKIGPRMRAVRASVLGERDSLAAVMANYTDEQKMREHQDSLAYAQGNEVKVDAQGFQVRSKRKVNFDNWSAIKFPNAEEAKNKGMQVEMSGGGKGSDWATLYQEKPRRWEPPSKPETFEEWKIRKAVNAAADKAAANPEIPSGEIAMTAARAEEVAKAAPEGVDKEAAGRDFVVGHLKGIGYVEDPLVGGWKTAEKIEPAPPSGEVEAANRSVVNRLVGFTLSQEQNILSETRRMGVPEVGRKIVSMGRAYSGLVKNHLADLRNSWSTIMRNNKLNPHDEKTMRDLFDVRMGKRAVADPRINEGAEGVRILMGEIREKGAAGGLAVRTPDGRIVPWLDFQNDPSYMPRIPDWDAKFTDGDKTYTLREIMGGTFSEIKAKELLAKKLKEDGNPMSADKAYQLIKRERLQAPVQGNIQRTNEVNFPFIKKDYQAIDNYFKQFARAMATEKEFGSDLRKLQKEIGKIPNKQFRTDVEQMFGYMFTPQNWNDSSLGTVYNALAAVETATKMFPFSVTKVLFHAANAPMIIGKTGHYMPVLKALFKTATDLKAVKENAYVVGTITHGVDPAVMYMPDTKTQHLLFKWTGFEYIYNVARAIGGESARFYLDQCAANDLKKGGNAEARARRLLKNSFLIGDHAIDEFLRTGKWDRDSYRLAQVAFADESLYSENPMQMPELARRRVAGEGLSSSDKFLNMSLRASYSLQSFTVKTYSMLKEHLYDEVVLHHNLRPLAYAAVVAPVLGQMLQGVSSAAKGGVHRLAQYGLNRPHTTDAWDKWLSQFSGMREHPAATFLKLYVDGLCSQWALERTKRLADAVFNLAIDTKESDKAAAAYGRYDWNDEVEQDLGPIWGDIVMRPWQFKGAEVEALAASREKERRGQPGTFLEQTGKNAVRTAEDVVPLLRQEPHVEEMLEKKKKMMWQVP